LPVWTEAMETELMGTCTIQSCATLETDPLIREAVMLLAQEEARHAAIIKGLTTRYGIPLPNLPPPQPVMNGLPALGIVSPMPFHLCAFCHCKGSGLVPRPLCGEPEP
jgi:hypothetical protein